MGVRVQRGAVQRQGGESGDKAMKAHWRGTGGGGNQGSCPEFADVGRLQVWLTGAALVLLAHYVGKPQVHVGQLCVLVSAR